MKGQSSSLILRNSVVQNFKNHFGKIEVVAMSYYAKFQFSIFIIPYGCYVIWNQPHFYKKCKIFKFGTLTLNPI